MRMETSGGRDDTASHGQVQGEGLTFNASAVLARVDVDMVFAQLRKRNAIRKVRAIERVREEPTLADDPAYRRLYNGYYKVGRKRAEFYDAYYGMLREWALAGRAPGLDVVLTGLYRQTGERHLSFSSKLVATLDPRGVIYDRNVASLLAVDTGPLGPGWLDELVTRFSALEQRMAAVIQATEWQAVQQAFDECFAEARDFSPARKADLILWAGYAGKSPRAPS